MIAKIRGTNMKIYTQFGDKGKTRLIGGNVVDKDHLRIEVYGTLDELNSHVGLAQCVIKTPLVNGILTRIQNDLFRISSILAAPDEKSLKTLGLSVSGDDIAFLEKSIDQMDGELPGLQNFILPGGSEAAARLHIARTVCRRAERHLTRLMHDTDVMPDILIYLNRLSDLFFVAARYVNHAEGIEDIPWQK